MNVTTTVVTDMMAKCVPAKITVIVFVVYVSAKKDGLALIVAAK